MPIKVIVTRDFDHMSEKAADIVKKIIAESAVPQNPLSYDMPQ